MADYIPVAERLTYQARHVVPPPEAEIQQAVRVLSNCPVPGFASFDEAEARLVGIYREYLSPRTINLRRDGIWDAIISDDWYAWIVAVHEAAELQAFAEQGINPFNRDRFNKHLEKAHLRGTVVELRFLCAWAKSLNLDVSELAIETENPIRKQTKGHPFLLQGLQVENSWATPTSEELALATLLWRQIKERLR